MEADLKVLEGMIAKALSGEGAHVTAKHAFDGLDWRLAGAQPDALPHSVFQLLNHMNYWNAWAVNWLAGKKPALPRHASSSWPGKPMPDSPEVWRNAMRSFDRATEEMIRASSHSNLLAKRGTKTPAEMLQTIASHNSYHLGQVVVIRQRLGAWPPASGGLTW